jgi:hypothetical protein
VPPRFFGFDLTEGVSEKLTANLQPRHPRHGLCRRGQKTRCRCSLQRLHGPPSELAPFEKAAQFADRRGAASEQLGQVWGAIAAPRHRAQGFGPQDRPRRGVRPGISCTTATHALRNLRAVYERVLQNFPLHPRGTPRQYGWDQVKALARRMSGRDRETSSRGLGVRAPPLRGEGHAALGCRSDPPLDRVRHALAQGSGAGLPPP